MTTPTTTPPRSTIYQDLVNIIDDGRYALRPSPEIANEILDRMERFFAEHAAYTAPTAKYPPESSKVD